MSELEVLKAQAVCSTPMGHLHCIRQEQYLRWVPSLREFSIVHDTNENSGLISSIGSLISSLYSNNSNTVIKRRNDDESVDIAAEVAGVAFLVRRAPLRAGVLGAVCLSSMPLCGNSPSSVGVDGATNNAAIVDADTGNVLIHD